MEQLNRVRRDKEKEELLRKKSSMGSLKKSGVLKIKQQEKPPRKGTN